MKPFGKFGFEPTFFPDIHLTKKDLVKDKWTDKFLDYYNERKLAYLINGDHFEQYCDFGSLETPTVNTYTSLDKFKRHYAALCRVMRNNNCYPSSSICLESEGGCHINIDLRKVKKEGVGFTRRFLENYRNLVVANPSIAWMFLSPYDNASSNIVYKSDIMDYCKGDFFYPRMPEGTVIVTERDAHMMYSSYGIDIRNRINNNISSVKYIEMRSFMMPRNDKEFDVHFDFANTLLHYVYNLTKDGKSVRVREQVLTDYTFVKSFTEFKRVCKEIGFDFDRVVEVGKLDLLWMRFELGKDYLV